MFIFGFVASCYAFAALVAMVMFGSICIHGCFCKQTKSGHLNRELNPADSESDIANRIATP